MAEAGYVVIGSGIPVKPGNPGLVAAARIATKLEDQGAENVHILDGEGNPVPRDVWEAAFWDWARTTRPPDIGL